MGRNIVFAIAWLVLLSTQSLAGGSAPIVAVFELQPKGLELKGRKALVQNLTEYLGTSLSECGAYRIVSQGDIRRALLEKAKETYKECYDQKCQIELGRELAANKTISSSILKIGTKCIVTSQVYDLRTQTTEISAKAEGACATGDLLVLVKQVAGQLCAKASGKKTAGKLDEILQKTQMKMKESERAKKAWSLIKKMAHDDSIPFEQRAEAVRAYIDEFGEKDPMYKQAKKLLSSIPASVRITTQPTGAAIKIDGRSTGRKTPVLMTVQPGEHAFRATSAGYFSKEKKMKLEPGENAQINLTLEPIAFVRLKVEPPGADVWLDGKKVGTVDRLQLRGGQHKLKVSSAGYQTKEQTLEAVPNKEIEIEVVLKATKELLEKQALEKRREELWQQEVASIKNKRSKYWWIGGALIGAGVAASITGAIFFKKTQDAMDSRDSYRTQWYGATMEPEALSLKKAAKDADEDARTYDIVGWVGVGAGAAVVVGGIVTLVLMPDMPDEQAFKEKVVKIEPVFTPGGGGLAMSWNW